MSRTLARKLGICFLVLSLLAIHFFTQNRAYANEGSTWNLMISRTGDCRIHFPSHPQMVQQSFQLSDDGLRLHYDVYIAPFEDKGVCLLLIAQYPLPITKGNEMAGLEGLLNGIIGHSSDNKLAFAKVIELQGTPGVDFLVNSKSNYFRGLAFMIENKLYLIAMEGKKEYLNEQIFNRFSNSFQLSEEKLEEPALEAP
jgi:hypothetical protein